MSSMAQAGTTTSVPKPGLTATIPPSGRPSMTGKLRSFADISQRIDTPEPATVAVDEQCPVHPWCIERGDHTEHTSEAVAVHVECGVDEAHNHGHAATPYIEARLFSEDDPVTGVRGARPVVFIDDCEVSADGARHETAKIRAALPRIEALADILDGKPAYTPPTGYDSAETIQTAGAHGALLKVYLSDPRDDEFYDGGPMTLAVFSESGSAVDLDLDGAIDFRNQLAALGPKVDAMISSLAADIHTEPPKTPDAQQPARLWTITTDRGAKVSGHLPAWAEEDPSQTVRAGQLELTLADLTHWTCFDGQTVHLDAPGFDLDRYTGPSTILRGNIDCRVYSDDPAERVPLVNVELTDDHWINNLDPTGVADLAVKLRAQADRLTNEVLPALVTAREDWAKNGGQQ